jgi:alginate O-acetyltransferase complex protein AlgJ
MRLNLLVWGQYLTRLRPGRECDTAGQVQRLSQWLSVVSFGLILLAPLVGFLVLPVRQPTSEKRPLLPPPALVAERWAVTTFPPMFEGYFNDRVGFRPELLAARRDLLYGTLHDTTATLVWPGRDGWLFINSGGARSGLPAHQRDDTPHLHAWAMALRQRQQTLAAQGIAYVVVIARDKHDIYPEYLPGAHQRHPPRDAVPRMRELLAGSDVNMLDLKPALLAAKTHTRVYLQRDSHWTDDGAFVGYTELSRVLSASVPGYVAQPTSAFDIRPQPFVGVDLATALGLPDHDCTEYGPVYRPLPPSAHEQIPTDLVAELGPSRLGHIPVMKFTQPQATASRALFLHDSFGTPLTRMLPGNFRMLACAGTYGFPTAFINEFQPTVVIQLVVERMLRIRNPD